MTAPGEGRGVRLFIGAELSLATVRELSDTAQAMAAACREAGLSVRWVDPPNYHVTLKYLGWSHPETIDAIRDAVGQALSGCRALELSCRSVGAFPKPERARVVWAGIDDTDGRVAKLAARIDKACAGLGYPAEKRPYHPHVTLGRVRKPGDASEVLIGWSEQVYRKTSVRSVVLFESILKSTGSVYETRARWSLEASSKRSDRHTSRVQRGKPTSPQDPARQDDHGITEQNQGEQNE